MHGWMDACMDGWIHHNEEETSIRKEEASITTKKQHSIREKKQQREGPGEGHSRATCREETIDKSTDI